MKPLCKYFILGSMAFLSVEVGAQQVPTGIAIRKNQIEVKAEKLHVNFDIGINELDIRSNQGVVLTPMIQSADSIKALPEVIINGRNRQISYDRLVDRQRKQASYRAPYAVVKYNKKDEVIISYQTEIPFEAWMENASLWLAKDLCECRNATRDMGKSIIARNIELPAQFVPLLTYLPVQTAPSKQEQEESIASVVFFPESEAAIRLDYMQNSTHIAQIDSILSHATLTRIQITGSASPEGTYLYNKQLSQERAQALADYIKARSTLLAPQEQINWVGENWNELLKLVEQSQMKNKAQVVDIIQNIGLFAGRERELMELHAGEPYKYMEEHFFPQLRNASYRLTYRHKEANTAVKSDPDQLAARINASSEALSRGNIAAAKQYLAQLEQQPQAWNNLGVIEMLEGNLESGRRYFQKAIQYGSLEATRNMEELTHKLSMNN